jgi:hypothetical protein
LFININDDSFHTGILNWSFSNINVIEVSLDSKEKHLQKNILVDRKISKNNLTNPIVRLSLK